MPCTVTCISTILILRRPAQYAMQSSSSSHTLKNIFSPCIKSGSLLNVKPVIGNSSDVSNGKDINKHILLILFISVPYAVQSVRLGASYTHTGRVIGRILIDAASATRHSSSIVPWRDIDRLIR